jgi:hypothetical protein
VRELVLELFEESDDTNIDFDVSVVYSRPGATTQGWHADGDHKGSDAGWNNKWTTIGITICGLFVSSID